MKKTPWVCKKCAQILAASLEDGVFTNKGINKQEIIAHYPTAISAKCNGCGHTNMRYEYRVIDPITEHMVRTFSKGKVIFIDDSGIRDVNEPMSGKVLEFEH